MHRMGTGFSRGSLEPSLKARRLAKGRGIIPAQFFYKGTGSDITGGLTDAVAMGESSSGGVMIGTANSGKSATIKQPKVGDIQTFGNKKFKLISDKKNGGVKWKLVGRTTK